MQLNNQSDRNRKHILEEGTLRDFLPLNDGKYKPVIRIPLFETKRTDLRLDEEAIIKRLENGLQIH